MGGVYKCKSRIVAFVFVLSVFVLVPPASAQEVTVPAPAAVRPVPPEPLTLADAVARALVKNPLPQAANARLSGANTRLSGAKSLPSTSLAVAQPYGSNVTGGFGEDVILSQTLEWPGKVQVRTRAASLARDVATTDVTAANTDLNLSVQSAYFEALRADAELQQANATLAITQKFRDAAQIQFDAGDIAKSNVIRSEVEVSRAEQVVLAADTDRKNRFATLGSLIGQPDTPLALADTLQFVPKTYDMAAVTAYALANRPDTVGARRLQAQRAAETGTAKAQRIPDLIIEGRRATLDRNTDQSIRFGVIAPLFDWGRIRSDVKSAQAAQTEQDAARREVERTARLEVETALRNREQAQALVASFQNGRLDRAKQILDLVQLGYTNGANSYLEAIDAQRTYQSEQIEYIRALATFNIATATLQRAVGGKLP